jgi:hypothetical protein
VEVADGGFIGERPARLNFFLGTNFGDIILSHLYLLKVLDAVQRLFRVFERAISANYSPAQETASVTVTLDSDERPFNGPDAEVRHSAGD